MVSVQEQFRREHGLTERMLDEMAEPYETGNFDLESGPVYTGSHLEAMRTTPVTVTYDRQDARQAATLAHARGVPVSTIYRTALTRYLAPSAS